MKIAVAGLVALGLAAPLASWAREPYVDPQGQAANWDGQSFEQQILQALKKRGFAAMPHKEWKDAGEPRGEYILTHAPYTTLYGGPGRTEFLLLSEQLGLKIRIEAKSQTSPGSVDEKLPYLYLSAIEAVPEKTVFVIIDGLGWRPGAVEWLKRAATERRYGTPADKDVRVMSLLEFREWTATLPPLAR